LGLLEVGRLNFLLQAIGIELAGSTPEALQREVVDEIAKRTRVIRDAKMMRE